MECHNLTAATPATSTSPSAANAVNYDVVVILAAMVCALVCALGLNSMLRCVARCTCRALTEPVGWVASRRLDAGLRREHVVALPVYTHSANAGPAGCPICLSDFSDGDKVRVLPACGHRFHVGCIDTWLLSHRSCPTCRHRLSAAKKKKKKTTQGSELPLEIVTAA